MSTKQGGDDEDDIGALIYRESQLRKKEAAVRGHLYRSVGQLQLDVRRLPLIQVMTHRLQLRSKESVQKGSGFRLLTMMKETRQLRKM